MDAVGATPDDAAVGSGGAGPMRVVYVHHGKVPGGAPTSLRNLIRQVRQQCPAIEIVVACAFEPMIPFFAEIEGVAVEKYIEAPVLSGKKLIGWSSFFDTRTLREFAGQLAGARDTIRREKKWLESRRPDIVHLNSATLWTSAIAARRANIPLVWHVREVLRGGRWNIRRLLYGRFVRRTAGAVIAISPTDAASLGEDRAGKVTVTYNPITMNQVGPATPSAAAVRADLGIAEDAFVILSLGGFSPRKGALQLVRALRRLPSRYHLLIAGGRLPEQTRAGARKKILWALEDVGVRLGLVATQTLFYAARVREEAAQVADRLLQVGQVEDVAPLIAASDVLVFGGTIPHFARPVYEAWLMKRPVIAFDTPVMRAEIDDSEDGLLVPRDSAERLVASVRAIDEDRPRAQRLGEKGHGKALMRIDNERNVQTVISIYRRLLGAR
jgi:glycosyltransferase involved in cell wall biosynthesis